MGGVLLSGELGIDAPKDATPDVTRKALPLTHPAAARIFGVFCDLRLLLERAEFPDTPPPPTSGGEEVRIFGCSCMGAFGPGARSIGARRPGFRTPDRQESRAAYGLPIKSFVKVLSQANRTAESKLPPPPPSEEGARLSSCEKEGWPPADPFKARARCSSVLPSRSDPRRFRADALTSEISAMPLSRAPGGDTQACLYTSC